MNIVHQKNMMAISELLSPSQEHASGLWIQTREEMFQEITQQNNLVNLSAPDHCKVEVLPQPSYSDFITAADVVPNYIRDKGSGDSNTYERALC